MTIDPYEKQLFMIINIFGFHSRLLFCISDDRCLFKFSYLFLQMLHAREEEER